MSYPGEVRYVDTTGNDDWHVYIMDASGMWLPVDHAGPGYLTDNQMDSKTWSKR